MKKMPQPKFYEISLSASEEEAASCSVPSALNDFLQQHREEEDEAAGSTGACGSKEASCSI